MVWAVNLTLAHRFDGVGRGIFLSSSILLNIIFLESGETAPTFSNIERT